MSEDKEHALGATIARKLREDENKIHTLVPTKSDKDVANELRDKLIQVYRPVLDILTEAKKAGFDVSVTTGADGFNIVRLMNIQIVKQY